MGGKSVYKPVILNAGFSTGISTQDTMGHVLVYTDQYSNTKGYEINLTVNNADIGSDVYIYANAKKGGTVTIVHGEDKRSFEIRSYQIICVGVYDGTPYDVTIKYQDAPGTSVFVYGYQLDQAGYQNMLDVLGDEQLEVTSYTDTSLSGHIDAKEDGLLFLSIPYAEGWVAEVDGKEAEITPIQDALMGIKLEKGSHDINLKYAPKAVKEGALISVVSIFLIVLVAFVPALVRKLKKNKNVPVAVSGVAPAEGGNAPEVSVEEVPVAAILPEDTAEPKAEDIPAEAGGPYEEPVPFPYAFSLCRLPFKRLHRIHRISHGPGAFALLRVSFPRAGRAPVSAGIPTLRRTAGQLLGFQEPLCRTGRHAGRRREDVFRRRVQLYLRQ